MVKKQINVDLNFIDPKIKIFRDLCVFVLSPLPKNENGNRGKTFISESIEFE